MHSAKRLDLELWDAYKRKDIDAYVRIRKLRSARSPFDNYRIKLMGELIVKEPDLGRVLDIGSNIGAMVRHYSKRSKKIVLCDSDSFVLKGARIANSCVKNLHLVSGNIKRFPFESNYFDTVILLETIEHVREDEHTAILRETLRIAKKGALIYISTPNKFSAAGLEGKLISLFKKGYKWDAWDNDHKCVYYAWNFIKFLKKFDKEIQISEVIGSYFLPGSITVRMPLFIQTALGFISYLVARLMGNMFPIKYIGFTTIAIAKKK